MTFPSKFLPHLSNLDISVAISRTPIQYSVTCLIIADICTVNDAIMKNDIHGMLNKADMLKNLEKYECVPKKTQMDRSTQVLYSM